MGELALKAEMGLGEVELMEEMGHKGKWGQGGNRGYRGGQGLREETRG